MARLRRWGLLDRLDATGTPPVRDVRFDVNGVVIAGRYPDVAGAGALYSPRREVLDTLLVQAAREAGAEVREDTIVDELVDVRTAGFEESALAARDPRPQLTTRPR